MPAVPETKAGWTNQLDALNSTNLNAYVRDPIRFLMNPPRARLRQTVPQALPNATAVAITFDAEVFDTDVDGIGGHSTSVNISRYTVRYPGIYQVSGGCSFSAAAGFRLVDWSLNSAIYVGTDSLLPAVSGTSTRVPARTELIPATTGDYIEMRIYHTGGSGVTTSVGNDEQPTMNVLWVAMLP
ncbi:hypothetical protein AB0A95_30830 [Micromonospora sp. NPDC049230]|uniref:hypothetical protein n=1 Tax=Micromonospora sp. NPDC049230 TaxID=3155502 RepID=UPI0034044138